MSPGDVEGISLASGGVGLAFFFAFWLPDCVCISLAFFILLGGFLFLVSHRIASAYTTHHMGVFCLHFFVLHFSVWAYCIGRRFQHLHSTLRKEDGVVQIVPGRQSFASIDRSMLEGMVVVFIAYNLGKSTERIYWYLICFTLLHHDASLFPFKHPFHTHTHTDTSSEHGLSEFPTHQHAHATLAPH
jgi:hypothetical protein